MVNSKDKKMGKTKIWSGKNGNARRKRALKKALDEKQGRICVRCGCKKNLTIHHLIPINQKPNLAFDVDNTVWLCEQCHKKEHDNRLVLSGRDLWKSRHEKRSRIKKSLIKQRGGLCEKCGRVSEKLELRHKISMGKRPDLVFDEANLQLLCEDCANK